jgi:hypothetical protein
MERTALFFAFALSLLPAAARAQAQVAVRIDIGLPAAPPLVVVQPGVQVVADFDEEVFYTGHWYWLRRDDGWYRARTPQATFAFVDPRQVPRALVRLTPGRYKRWRQATAEPPPPARPPPPMPPPRMPPPPPAPADVLRVKEIKAGRVHARVIYAKEVKAKGGHIGRIFEDREDKRWERGRADGEIKMPEVSADVIYAKEVEADWLEAGEVHAQEVKIGR